MDGRKKCSKCENEKLKENSTKDQELREAFIRKDTEPLLKQDHQQKRTENKFSDYQLQFCRAYQFIK